MRLSSSLPPAGFTRAEPRPPGRRPPRAAVGAVALVLGAGLLWAVGHGTSGTAPARVVPARTATPEAATPTASARPSGPPSGPSPGAASASGGRTAAEPRARSSAGRPRTPRRTDAAPSPREKGRPARRPRPAATRTPRAARPAPPSWIAAECRRRYPSDPFRRSACVAALKEALGR